MGEPQITINGVKLAKAQAMVVRLAVSNLLAKVKELMLSGMINRVSPEL